MLVRWDLAFVGLDASLLLLRLLVLTGALLQLPSILLFDSGDGRMLPMVVTCLVSHVDQCRCPCFYGQAYWLKVRLFQNARWKATGLGIEPSAGAHFAGCGISCYVAGVAS
ncbi:hypothetical protein Nepgr_021444 [Nepenthes gracilis]|uniref:Uncharacterized protein n=1 Tax=Nepenthes gracilis TaxID=150966 RepID=A0AAD3XW34_NEPGR|nr:hypothetical protein Nepgr_021444 [Nepenthes gracilis]